MIAQPGQTLCDHVIKFSLLLLIYTNIIIFQIVQLNQFCASPLFSQMASLLVSPSSENLYFLKFKAVWLVFYQKQIRLAVISKIS